ncbi:DUF397 domain-containing protein [Actinoalloteichus sp. AHMU CJ021]|uniref:DUF397 domain-containing protein n=1 Tax=Actinoalloteichus TaxID=65496 RepID=UPI000CA043A8|nr:DUF397 domain-containing protein [Actinoalloteichus sp. AHMU CJ021]
MVTAEAGWSWRTSSRSNDNGQCVEIGRSREASGTEVAGIRDTKNRDGGTLRLDNATLTTFLNAVKVGRF